jgi:tRNA(Ile)-lysidine synthase
MILAVTDETNEDVPRSRLPLVVHRCLRHAEDTLRKAGLGDEAVLLAVSGGSDSMALLEIATMLAPRLGLTLHVAWVDHRLRASSAGEGRMVRAAAEARGAVFHEAAIDPGRGDEDTLRRARHAALEGLAKAAGCRFLLLGHTADDQVETVVFRFLRGAGFGGLAGMRAIRPPLVRPLLGLRREDLRQLLRERGVAWATDSTNLSWRYARGRLRRTVLPGIEAAFGAGAADHLLDVAPRWRADEDFLEQQTARLMAYASRRGDDGTELDLVALAETHPALRARALRTWIAARTGHVPGSRELGAVERWLEGGALDGPGRAGSVDVARARLERRSGRLAAVVTAFASEPMDNDSDRGDTAESPAGGAAGAEPGGEALLPPSEARVRFPRN